MQCIAEMPRELLRSFDGVCFDLDDTLTRRGIVEAEAFAALHALRARGLRTGVVTGRPLGWAEVLTSLWPIDFAVGENGAGFFVRRALTVERGWFEDDAEVRVQQRVALERLTEALGREMPDIVRANDCALRRCDVAFDIAEHASVRPERTRELIEKIEARGMRSLVSSVHVHAVPGDWDKARGTVKALGHAFGVSEGNARRKFVFIGDSGNDAAAFSFFEECVGVANIAPHLSKLARPPRWVTLADRGRGFAEFAAKLLEARS